jgi:hypothetical protein
MRTSLTPVALVMTGLFLLGWLIVIASKLLADFDLPLLALFPYALLATALATIVWASAMGQALSQGLPGLAGLLFLIVFSAAQFGAYGRLASQRWTNGGLGRAILAVAGCHVLGIVALVLLFATLA